MAVRSSPRNGQVDGPVGGRATVAIFVFAFLGWTFDFYDLVLLGFIKDGVGRDLHLSHTAESWLLGAGLGASGIGGLVAGALADRLGKRTVLSVTVLVYSLGIARSAAWRRTRPCSSRGG